MIKENASCHYLPLLISFCLSATNALTLSHMRVLYRRLGVANALLQLINTWDIHTYMLKPSCWDVLII